VIAARVVELNLSSVDSADVTFNRTRYSGQLHSMHAHAVGCQAGCGCLDVMCVPLLMFPAPPFLARVNL
jgi:hypothetical protein